MQNVPRDRRDVTGDTHDVITAPPLGQPWAVAITTHHDQGLKLEPVSARRVDERGFKEASECVYVDVEGLVVGGYPDTLIIIQSQVEKDELCGEKGRTNYVVRRAGGPGLCVGFGHSVED
ncbi:hypothetical protein LR48_Vigan02g178600 [Vigna angularis]|uniref:Uncharacterized protein n=1 Tax=Phaseolus angularis TaxID=3914 RepID=A0A0L9TYQ2_PHAAN|nr:hypothetical protein LR48_Vigan02g178600 [Vigna angularis]